MMECLRTLKLHGKLTTSHLAVIGIMASCSLTPAQATADSESAASTYKARCEICHAEDGSGTALGNRLHVRDLRTKEVQEKSESELAQTISAGKDNMPAFKDKIDSEQIQKLVEYIRHELPKAH